MCPQNAISRIQKIERKIFTPLSTQAVDKVVAQVSNLLYRRASSLPSRADHLTRPKIRTVCRLEIGDTAGWKPVGNLRYAELAGPCQWPCCEPSQGIDCANLLAC